MNRILSVPLLPAERVTSVAVSGEYKEIIYSLNDLGIDCFEIKPNKMLDSSISSHADCSILQLSENIFVCDEYIIDDFSEFLLNKTGSIVKILTNRAEETDLINHRFNDCNTIYIVKEKVTSPYPNDIKLNVKVSGKSVICNTKYVSSFVLNYCKNNYFKIIHTNQGYSACSTLLLNNNHIITDDTSINSAVHTMEIFSTMLSKGSIKLKDCNYGFIGGCCGFIDKNTLAFTGKLDSHEDSNLIKNTLLNNNIEYIELTDNELIDIGGIIPLTQYTDIQ